MFHRDIQTPRREFKIRRAGGIDEIRGVWIDDETLSGVFDISSQSKQKLRSKFLKIYANLTSFPGSLILPPPSLAPGGSKRRDTGNEVDANEDRVVTFFVLT